MKATDIAERILYLADKEGLAITHLKLQKLLYFANGIFLALTQTPLIDDEIEAWQYGPVYKRVWDTYKKYKGSDIPSPTGICEDSELDTFLKKVLEAYGKYTPAKLVALTHLPNSPWEKAIKNESPVIPIQEVQSYFQTTFGYKA